AALHLWRAGHAAAAALALKLLFLAAFGLRGALLLTRLSVGERSRTDGESRNSRESQRCHAHVFPPGFNWFNPWCKPTRRPWLSSSRGAAINLSSLVIRSGTNRRVGAIRALDARAICALDDPPRTVGRVVLGRPRHLVEVVRIVRTPRLVLIDA